MRGTSGVRTADRDTQRSYLRAIGVNLWAMRHAASVDKTNTAESWSWETLESAVARCRQCELHQSRQQTVFGVGSHVARCLIVGEAPGAEEDRRGEPFVGRAGQLLNAMLRAIGLTREEVYIANILKCRPPGNRDPRPAEMLCCEPYLQAQIDLLGPKVIVAAGRIAAQTLLGTDEPIGRLRGRQHVYGPDELPMIVTYHPAYLLRNPAEKAKSWDDLKRLKTLLTE